jgi:hypothetical protein
MFNLCRANGAIQIDQTVNPLHIVGVRHTALAVCQAFPAEIAIFFMGIAGIALAVVRMAGQMHCVCIGRVMVYQFVFAVVVGPITATTGAMLMPMVVVMSMVVAVVMSVVVVMRMLMDVIVTMFMVVIVIMIVRMLMPMIVIVIMFMQMFVGHAFPMGMGRNMVVVMDVLVGMLLHDTVNRIFLNCIHVLHLAASFSKGAYSRVFRTAANLFQVSHFFFHIVTHLSLRLSSGTAELLSRFPSLISLPG